MPRVEIVLNGRIYAVNCEVGEEARVRELGAYIDSHLRDIALSAPGGSDAHILMLTSLVLADRVFDLMAEVSQLRAQVQAARTLAAQAPAAIPAAPEVVAPPPPPPPPPPPEMDGAVVSAVDNLAKRLEDIAARLERP